jgi:hypothetical protein
VIGVGLGNLDSVVVARSDKRAERGCVALSPSALVRDFGAVRVNGEHFKRLTCDEATVHGQQGRNLSQSPNCGR